MGTSTYNNRHIDRLQPVFPFAGRKQKQALFFLLYYYFPQDGMAKKGEKRIFFVCFSYPISLVGVVERWRYSRKIITSIRGKKIAVEIHQLPSSCSSLSSGRG